MFGFCIHSNASMIDSKDTTGSLGYLILSQYKDYLDVITTATSSGHPFEYESAVK